jgi:hypothetical protein
VTTFFVKNLTVGGPDTTDYPGIRIDSTDQASAALAFRVLTSAPPTDHLRVITDGAGVVFYDVAAGTPVVVSVPRAPLPPVGS